MLYIYMYVHMYMYSMYSVQVDVSESSSRVMDILIYEDQDGEVENSSDCDQISEVLHYNSHYDAVQLSDNNVDDQLAERDSNSCKNQQEVQRSIMKKM